MHEEAIQKTLEYNYDHKGRCTNPGKFQDERLATIYYWTILLDGCDDESIGPFSAFQPTIEEREVLCLSKPWYVLQKSDDGFVHGWEASEQEWRNLVATYDTADDESSPEEAPQEY